MLTTNNLETTYGVSADFWHNVDDFAIRLRAATASLSAIHVCNCEEILTSEAYDDAVFGALVNFEALTKEIRELVNKERTFPCVLVKEGGK